MNNKTNLFIPSVIIGIALIICSIIIVAAWKANYRSNQTINVTGSAKQEITSDLGVLKGTLKAEEKTPENAYKKLLKEKSILISYLESKGFSKDKIDFFTINSYPVYEIGPNGRQTGNVKSYVYNQRIEFQSEDVNKIKEISIDIASLIEKDVDFSADMPEYHYTKLADLKINIQAAAAKDAMVRAKKIAEATDRELGVMRDARMGVLQITPKLSNQVSNYGINDLTSIEKEITAVVSASFQIQ